MFRIRTRTLPGETADEQLALRGIGALAFDHLRGHLLAQAFGPSLGELDALVKAFDLGLEVVGRDIAFAASAGGIVLLSE